MELFVYEYSCCQPLPAGSTARALRAEGQAMLSAILADFARIPGVTVVTLLAEDHAGMHHPFRRVGPTNEETVFRERAARAEHTLVIAPECDGLLEERCRWAEEAGGHLLGPGRAAIRLAGDKLALAQHLSAHHIPTPDTIPLCLLEDTFGSFPAVCKPRHGAGSQSTYLVETRESLQRIRDTERGDFIVQPYVPGLAVSVAFLIGPRRRECLPPAWQVLSDDGRFHYRGGRAPLPDDLAVRAQSLASAALDTLPGLRGDVGVDLILGEAGDGSQDTLIEINPRLTTSYVGLRELGRVNLAEVMLRLVRDEEAPELAWRAGSVTWSTAALDISGGR